MLDHSLDLLVLSRCREDVDASRAAVFVHDATGIKHVERLRHFLRVGGLHRVNMQERLTAARTANGSGKLLDVDGLQQVFDDLVLGGVRGDEQLIRPLVRSDLHLRLGRGRHGDDRTSVAIPLVAPARVGAGRARTSPFGDGLDSPLQAEHRSDLVLGIEGVDVLQFVSLVGDVGRSRVQADQQVVNSLQVRAGVGDADRVRPLQRDHFALRTDQIFGLFGRLVGSDVLDSQHDVHQLVLPALRQVRHLHMRNQVGRDRVVNVDDHQKLIAANKDITLLQQVAVDDVERLLRRVLLLVEIVERSRRDNIEVERQPGEFRKGLQDVGPRSVSKVEGHFFRLGRLGLGCFPFRRLIDGTLGRGSRESKLVSRFPERHNRLARLVITCQ